MNYYVPSSVKSSGNSVVNITDTIFILFRSLEELNISDLDFQVKGSAVVPQECICIKVNLY